jgi:protein-S-isoprenylcysteine O-methyltransferase Ste14
MAILFLRMSFALPLLLALLLYVFYPPWLDWSRVALPDWVRWIAVGVAVLCIPLAWWVFRSIGNNISETVLTKRTHQLVSIGPYRWIRHPLYALSMLLLLTLAVMASNWFLALYWLLTVLVFRLIVIPKEEGFLIKAFGDEYLNYRQGTGALLPRVFGPKVA